MIRLTGLNNKELVINCDQIEKIEAVPETVITLVNGNKYLVQEEIDEVIELTVLYKQKIFNHAFSRKET